MRIIAGICIGLLLVLLALLVLAPAVGCAFWWMMDMTSGDPLWWLAGLSVIVFIIFLCGLKD